MKYSVCVLLLAVCCAAQTATTQTANTNGAGRPVDDSALVARAQDITQDTSGQATTTSGQTTTNQSTQPATTTKPSEQTTTMGQPATADQTTSGQAPTGGTTNQTTSGQTTTTTTTHPSGETTTSTTHPSGQTTTTTTKPSGKTKTSVHATASKPTGQADSTANRNPSTNEPAWDWATGVSIGVAYSYTTGSPGLGSFNLGAGYRWKQQFELTTDMDFGTQTVDISPVFNKTKRQNYLFGGRYYIGKALGKHSKFEPFGHLMYGVSHQSINTQVGTPVTNEISTAQTSWAWDFGGGVDYLLSKHWALRGRADWLKTHFNSQGQNHFKWVAGFWYSFSARKFIK